MTLMRQSAAAGPNEHLLETPVRERQSNSAWLKATGVRQGIILLGGCSVAHFRLRVAQSHLRRDLTPSCWSFVGILDGEAITSVPLDLAADASDIVLQNGVQECGVADYDDPERFPNIAVLSFASDFGDVLRGADLLKAERTIVDLPSLMLNWLGYLWSTGQVGNPLAAGYGVPSAVFVETVYGMTGVELTPGLASSASCPEAIWQSAKWWHNFYKEEALDAGGPEPDASDAPDAAIPKGFYMLRQAAATAVGPKDRVRRGEVVRQEEPAPPAAGGAQRGAKKAGAARSAKRGAGRKAR